MDPGETTGWSLWDGTELVDMGQDPLWKFIDGVDAWLTEQMAPYAHLNLVEGFPRESRLHAIVCEDFVLYPWEAQNLVWDKFRTVRGIGALQLLARQHNIPFIEQGAKIKEAAVAAGAEELFVSPRHENRHANDAIMHGVYYLALNKNVPPGEGNAG